MLPGLLSRVPADGPVASVTADGAHDGRACRGAILGRGADAIIPPRRNARPWKKDSPGAPGRNETLRALKRLGRTIWRRRSRYHRRSRAETRRDETRMNRMKLPGQNLVSRDFHRRTTGIRLRIAILDRFTALGIPAPQPVG
jgi:hypothetical protein